VKQPREALHRRGLCTNSIVIASRSPGPTEPEPVAARLSTRATSPAAARVASWRDAVLAFSPGAPGDLICSQLAGVRERLGRGDPLDVGDMTGGWRSEWAMIRWHAD